MTFGAANSGKNYTMFGGINDEEDKGNHKKKIFLIIL